MQLRDASSAYIEHLHELRQNPQQWEAYESQKNCVVLAGPGSGKTKILVLKLARILAEDIHKPRGVACITYSQECARELTRRLEKLNIHESSRLFIGTVHGFCLRHLLIPYARLANLGLPYPIKVATIEHCKKTYEQITKQLFGQNFSYKREAMDKYRRTHLDRTSHLWREHEELATLSEAYEKALLENGLIDFEDLVIYGERLVTLHDWVLPLINARFPVLAVDEYQDLGMGLHRIVKRLVFDGGVRLFAVGDADQLVYAFNGANSNFLNELACHPNVLCVQLKTNYRCAEAIVRASERALGEVRNYQASDIKRQAVMEMIECTQGLLEQAEYTLNTIIPAALLTKPGRKIGDIAVLYRNAEIGNLLADAATAKGIDFIRIDNAAPYRKCALSSWIEDCAGWCSGGWRDAHPPLRKLIGRWLVFYGHRLHEHNERTERRKLTKFLWAHRHNNAARDFVKELRVALINPLLSSEPSLDDQAIQIEAMTKALEPGGPLQDLDMARLGGRDGSPNQLNLLTLHSAKGCEYDVVIMLGLDEGVFHWTNVKDDELKESQRLFYVGITRARDEVFMLYSGWNENKYGRRFYSGRLRFLDEI
jgi:DNA helicase-2/ATP-dependent DNA helicase PcrA